MDAFLNLINQWNKKNVEFYIFGHLINSTFFSCLFLTISFAGSVFNNIIFSRKVLAN